MDHPHLQKASPVMEKAPAAAVEKIEESSTSSTTTSTRAPRDPHGHKLVKLNEVFDSAHKTKYLPLGDGQYTYIVYLQPVVMRECGKNWCEVEMLELIYGTTMVMSNRIYNIDSEDLLKMCYLHDMAQFSFAGKPRLHFEQWVLTIFQEYCTSCGHAEYNDRGAIASYYLEKINNSFKVGGETSTIEMFFQKRCIRDLSTLSGSRSIATTAPIPNVNAVFGKSAKSKFEYQIEAYMLCVPNEEEEIPETQKEVMEDEEVEEVEEEH